MDVTLFHQAKLYAILDTGYSDPATWPEMAAQLIAGGVGIIQVRAKHAEPAQIKAWALSVQPLLREKQVPLVINDYPELAGEIGADAVHVGQDDLSVAEALVRSGGCLVGKSTHSLQQAIDAQAEGADYIGFGPLFSTPTKPDYAPIGLDDIRAMSEQVSIPHFCIGGIKKEHIPTLKSAGAQRVVIVSGLLQAEDPAAYAREVIGQLN